MESGIWIIDDSKMLNWEEPRVENPSLETLEVESFSGNALDILGNFFPCQPVDPDASMERGHMDGPVQRSCGAACLNNRYR